MDFKAFIYTIIAMAAILIGLAALFNSSNLAIWIFASAAAGVAFMFIGLGLYNVIHEWLEGKK